MNWMLRFRRLLGRFWHDVFGDAEFLLGVEYLHSIYSKLIENQYLNWRNGMIAKDTSVEQDMQPVVVYLQTDTTREWYPLEKIFAPTNAGRASAKSFASNTMQGDDQNTGGWLTDSRDPVPGPVYMLDHVYGYTRMLVRGLDYDVQDSHFLFYIDPALLELPVVKMLDRNGVPHQYYKLFGYPRKTTKVCDPVTGFESSWLNPFSDIVWDIHQNGATFYNMKQLLGKATGSIICEQDGLVTAKWTEQGWNCLSVGEKAYMSRESANVSVGAQVKQGDVLFGSLKVWKGTEDPTAADVPGIRVQTDAGELVALNEDGMEPYDVDGILVLPLSGLTDNAITLANYKAICGSYSGDKNCPYIQVPTEVNPYKFVTKTLRRGRSVTVALSSTQYDMLAAALTCLRKSCCASGIVNVYVATTTASDDASDYYKPLLAICKDVDAPIPTEEGQQYYSLDNGLIHTSYKDERSRLYWLLEDDEGHSIGDLPELTAVYINQANDKVYVWDSENMNETTKTKAATINLSCFAADAGMLAVATVETLKVKDACADAEVLL